MSESEQTETVTEKLKILPQVSISELFLGKPPSREEEFQKSWNFDGTKARPIYHELAEKKLSPYLVQSTSGTDYYLVGPPDIDGREITTMLYSAAPDKKYGFVTYNIIKHAKLIFEETDNESVRTLAAHRKHLPGFRAYETIWKPVTDSIEDYHERILFARKTEPQNDTTFFTPIIHFRIADLGLPNLVIDEEPNFPATMLSDFRKNHPDLKTPQANISSLLGALLVATFSPEITHHQNKALSWPIYRNYTGKARHIADGDPNEMTPVQVFPLVLSYLHKNNVDKVAALDQSQILARGLAYFLKGQPSELKIADRARIMTTKMIGVSSKL